MIVVTGADVAYRVGADGKPWRTPLQCDVACPSSNTGVSSRPTDRQHVSGLVYPLRIHRTLLMAADNELLFVVRPVAVLVGLLLPVSLATCGRPSRAAL